MSSGSSDSTRIALTPSPHLEAATRRSCRGPGKVGRQLLLAVAERGRTLARVAKATGTPRTARKPPADARGGPLSAALEGDAPTGAQGTQERGECAARRRRRGVAGPERSGGMYARSTTIRG